MKACLLAITCLLTSSIFSSGLVAQQPTQLVHEKRVFEKDGNTYVQKELPIYFKFSTSPGGQQYDLNSKRSAEYTNPMYLDTEGPNFIRSKWAVDKTTKRTASPQQEIMYELYADGTPPYSSHSFSGAPSYTSGTTYFGKGLTLSLSARDAVSGVDKTHYALNSQTWKDYASSQSIDSEGDYNLYYYSNDLVGNAERVRSSSFVVDLTAPATNHDIVGIVHNGNILAPSTRFSLSKTDALSGVRITKYSFDSGSERTHSGNIPMSGLSDGDHTLYYYSTDKVKNEEQKNSFAFYLDRIPPVVDYTVNGDQYKGQNWYVSPRSTVTFTATDNKAGVHKIYYRVDGGERNDFTSDVSIPNVQGNHTFKYDATDKVENLAPNKYLTLYMDNVDPTTGIDYGNPQFFTRDTLFINKNTDIKLFASDRGAGVQRTLYKVDGGSYKDYSLFTIPNEGHHIINFYSTDRVNNEEQEKTSKVFVDNGAPVISHNFSIEAIGTKKDLPIYPNYARLYLGATDDHVGTDEIKYSINDGPMTLYSSSTTLDISERDRFLKKNIKYTVEVIAKDKLGNTSEKTILFYVGLE